jgi:hypothetical protein
VKETGVSYKYGGERVGRHDGRRFREVDDLEAADKVLEDDDDDENAERIESNEERGDTSVNWRGIVPDISDSSKASSCSCQCRFDPASPLRNM